VGDPVTPIGHDERSTSGLDALAKYGSYQRTGSSLVVILRALFFT
jgi:hypothetical protein